jgi:hypothetical protein
MPVISSDLSPKNQTCDSGKEVWYSTQHINTLGLNSSSLKKEIVPMKKWIMFVCCFALFACNSAVRYVPNPNVSDPAKVIERIINPLTMPVLFPLKYLLKAIP